MIPFPQILEAEKWLRQNATGPASVYLFTTEHAMMLLSDGGWYFVQPRRVG